MGKAWRFIDTGHSTGAFNMAVDEALLHSALEGKSGPVLRVFGWKPPAVSLGYGQDPRRELDLDKCRRAGIDIVRRPTGGRAVLHWEELTYSVIVPEDELSPGGGIERAYGAIGLCLVEGLRCFGVEVALERARARARRPRAPGASAPCFSSIARWEIKCGGRKLIGSAQRRVRGIVLQHGSLLMGAQHEKILDLLPAGVARGGAALARQLQSGSTCLEACCGRRVRFAELAACLAEGFRRQLQVEVEPAQLSAAERRRAAALEAEKYGNPLWNGAAPAPTRCPTL